MPVNSVRDGRGEGVRVAEVGRRSVRGPDAVLESLTKRPKTDFQNAASSPSSLQMAATANKVPAQAHAYNESEAVHLLTYMAAAYCKTELMAHLVWSSNCSICREEPNFVMTGRFEGEYATFGFVGYDADADYIILSFEGSHNWENWILDGKYWTTAYPGIPGAYVHRGFYYGYQSVRGEIRKALGYLMGNHTGAPLFVVGHSLGAALGAVAALDLTLDPVSNDTEVLLYTMGAPRVFNEKLADLAMGLIKTRYHITHNADIVTHLPPLSIPEGEWGWDYFQYYHHMGTEVWYPQNDMIFGKSKYIVCDGGGEDYNCSDSLEPYQYSVSDHLKYFQVPISQSCNLPTLDRPTNAGER
jgi:hypothetical protein